MMKSFKIALQFLTILPLRIESKLKEEDFGRALLYFPLVGLLIGFLLCSIAAIFSFLPNLVLAALILIASIVITGGIHLDGFSDTGDGFYGRNSRERILEIMRDSRIGVMGVIGIVSILLLKFTLFTSMPKGILWKSLIMMPVFARWSQVFVCFYSKYARREGKAKCFIEHAGKKELILGAFFTIMIFLLLAKVTGLILFTLAFFPVFIFTNYAKNKIGGMTGDTIGAASEIAEVSVLLFTLICLGERCFY